MKVLTTFLYLTLSVYNFTSACKYVVDPAKQDMDWWKSSTIYQIYPRSFKDSNGDGIGDLPGITSKLEHLQDIGVTALWLSPIFKSPQADFGYDISNFTDIHEEYGTLDDFDKLAAKAKSLGLKLMLDYVPNHTSNEHEWFKKSIKRIAPYDDYFVWKDPKYVNGQNLPPNNWLSAFGNSAWEWNEERKQYYYHAFAIGQPDLNYRNAKVRQEMEDVFTFWMKRGVDGFRVDAINHMFESEQLQDEPESGNNVPSNDYNYLRHIYTRDLNETYDVVASWSKLIRNFVASRKVDDKILLMEAYTTIPLSMKYYDSGSNPFNFMFIASLNNDSTALDFKKLIDQWNNAIPENEVANWVTGNHDNHRAASRFGIDNNRADQLSMLGTVLPGILVVYNGDEIGMVDREFTYQETIDPPGVIAGPDRYYLYSRDPERTPYQWDSTTSAGFSTNSTTWLPVNNNYKTLNLEAQKLAEVSHYKVFKTLTKLKKHKIIKEGSSQVLLASENVLAVVRRIKGQDPIVLLINFSYRTVSIDARAWLNTPENLSIYAASVKSGLRSNDKVDMTNISLPAAASVILASSSVAA